MAYKYRYKYNGFWRAMDTLRHRQVLKETFERGETPWRVPQRMPHQGKAGS
jgi:glucose-1-phosphate cytidylyltransferase